MALYQVKSGFVVVVDGRPFPALARLRLEGAREAAVLATHGDKLRKLEETEDRGLRAPSHDRAVRPKGA